MKILSVSGLTSAEWSIVLTDDEQQRQLNASFRGFDRTTDVLSFPSGDRHHPQVLGDVTISIEQAERQRRGDPLEHEIIRLLAHGLCHLMGHDHRRATERERMRQAEQRLLVPFALDSMLA